MVKAVAESQDNKMLSFEGYTVWTIK
ncbi:hypothetical protein I6E29_08560 [Arcanobacterium haemolyticum]|nr:hypothetical protein [Arcanobacterium haemolyticum]